MKEFARLRATADLGGQQTSTIGALVRASATSCLVHVYSSWSRPEELREALAGVEALDVKSGAARRS